MQCLICKSKKVFLKHSVGLYKFYFCKQCQCLQLRNVPKKTTNYSKFDYKTGFQNEKNIRSRAKIILSNLKKINPNFESVLDIGCGAGFLLDEFGKYFRISTGIEPSTNLALYAKDKFNLEIYNKYLKEGLFHSLYNKFDVIILSHVIEHVNNPKVFLELVGKFLKKNGILYVGLSKLEGNKYTFLTPPEHLFVFSKKSLHIVINRLGWGAKIVKFNTYSDDVHIVGIIRILKKKIFRGKGKKNIFVKSGVSHKMDKVSNKENSLVNFLTSFFHPFINACYKGSYLVYYIKKST